MQKRNHIWLGAIFVFLFVLLLGWLKLNWISFSLSSLAAIVIITVFYSLLPDIDHKNSTITWWFFGIGILGLALGMFGMFFKLNFIPTFRLMLFSTMLLVFTYLATNLFEHRGKIHTVQAGLIAIIPLFLLLGNFAYCALAYVAWHSHLVGDGYVFKVK